MQQTEHEWMSERAKWVAERAQSNNWQRAGMVEELVSAAMAEAVKRALAEFNANQVAWERHAGEQISAAEDRADVAREYLQAILQRVHRTFEDPLAVGVRALAETALAALGEVEDEWTVEVSTMGRWWVYHNGDRWVGVDDKATARRIAARLNQGAELERVVRRGLDGWSGSGVVRTAEFMDELSTALAARAAVKADV